MSVKCFFVGHKVEDIRKLSSQADLVRCVNCGGLFARHNQMQAFIEWDKAKVFYNKTLK